MKILVLNGSPKREKSDTMRITRAFLSGTEDAASVSGCLSEVTIGAAWLTMHPAKISKSNTTQINRFIVRFLFFDRCI